MAIRSAPAPGQAALPAPNAAAMLRRNGTDPDRRDRPAILADDQRWTHGEVWAEARRYARWFRATLDPDRPPHVAVLLDNVPEYLFALAGAGIAGAAVVGLNHTRQGEHLRRDVSHTDCQLVLTEPRHVAQLDAAAIDLPRRVVGDDLAAALAAATTATAAVDGDATAAAAAAGDTTATAAALAAATTAAADGDDATAAAAADGDATAATDGDLALDPDVASPWTLIFTSGTSSAPKAVICSQRRLLVTGNRMTELLGVGPDDIGYVCMPLFHSNALMVGWAPALVAGAAVGLARRFSASGWLADVRRYGATWFNYTGKPLSYLVATPERPDDADNPLRIAYGNEGSPEVVAAFARRFDVEVVDAFGATEGGVAVQRVDDMPTGAVGLVTETVKVVDEQGVERPRATFDDAGRLTNADDSVGEIVNTAGAGPFEGYYANPEANARALRNGWYWSGDLGYVTEDGWLYFAGRAGDWIRVDGENFPAGPIEAAIARHPDVVVAAAYGVPDVHAGDQLAVAVVVRDGAAFDPHAFAAWIDGLADLGPKWRPRYVRVAAELPTTGTNKIVKRRLVHDKVRRDRVGPADELWVRDRGEAAYRPFTADDEAVLLAELTTAGRQRFWDL